MAGQTGGAVRSARFASWFNGSRNRLGQTQTQAAAQLGVPQTAVSRWEGGGVPGAEHILAIAKWADVETDHVLKLIAADQEARR